MVRNGIIKSLSPYFLNAIYGEASNSAEVLQHVNNSGWDLLILDISMPGRNGLEVLKEVKTAYPEIKVIVLSMYPEEQFAVRCIKKGASAYLTKDIPSNELAFALKKILKGERYLTPSLMELIANDLQQNNDDRGHDLLSDREHQVLILIASGKSVSTIAEELSLSVKTISVYRANILKKMKIKNNSEITYYAFKNNLVK
ncbi:MAG: response regulator transcription factor [Bacteroidia bacterium]|nr:MAG: response regulator transcription factor [Bacteroidia bacterium]